MKYLKLFLPIPLVFLLIFISEQYVGNVLPVGVYFIKAGLFIYYLRLDNAGTPLINTLTVILLSIALGEYLLTVNITLGQIIFSISSIAFGLLYFLRQELKEAKDKLSKLKIAAVSIFVLTNILRVGLDANMVLVATGALFITSVYFYDRLVTIADSKEVGA
jgi:hypothetical protein